MPRLAARGQESRKRVADASQTQLEHQIAADLVARIRRGERAAEAEMAARYGRGLFYLLRRRTGDPELALDLRQDAFVVAIRKLRAGALNEPERLAGYLRGVALNLLLAEQRKTARRATSVDSDAVESAPDPGQGPFDHVSTDEIRQAVRSLLQELRTPRDREILTRLYIHEEDRESVCRNVGVDAVHFNRVLFRAKQRFRELLLGAERKNTLQLVGRDPET
jgi:RNA polymerase sigma-70 factor (ECF subfamily)